MKPVTIPIPRTLLESIASLLPRPGTVAVTVEVLAEEMGDQIEAEECPLNAIVYDSRNDILEVSVTARGGGSVVLRHEIASPTDAWIELKDGRVESFAVKDRDARTTIVHFHERTALEPPHGPSAPLTMP
jgi:hypothetical protein